MSEFLLNTLFYVYIGLTIILFPIGILIGLELNKTKIIDRWIHAGRTIRKTD